eukprot:gi/632956693/ref/XP_007894084.1/ PREDICTED: zona pellucida-like domain-containing protein 1 [Callorhinchus milii]
MGALHSMYQENMSYHRVCGLEVDKMFSLIYPLIALTMLKEVTSIAIHEQECDTTYRLPDNKDITVTCGTEQVHLSIYLCPLYFAGSNESFVALNNQFSNTDCRGSVDATVSPPLLRFSFSINDNDATSCGSHLQITSAQGTGIFKDFSNIESVNISGIINSYDPTASTITYNQELVYQYSCNYPLEYFVNNTRLEVAGVSIAIKDNNGTFRSTLNLRLYSDTNYTNALIIPDNGLALKTKIYVEVKATNLTDRFNVLLDHCFASTSYFPLNSSSSYDLFIGCTKDQQTNIISNGENQFARFYFEAFRFTEHRNLPTSTYYLHCITRLCEKSACSTFSKCKRRKRQARDLYTTPGPSEASDPVTITSPLISTMTDNVVKENYESGKGPLLPQMFF